jgi:hypothetical protein
MAQLEESPERPPTIRVIEQRVPSQPERADPRELEACLTLFDHLPAWLRELLRLYLTRRWRDWQPHLARQNGRCLVSQLGRAWEWLLSNRELSGWSDLQRSDLEAWLSARQQAGAATSTQISPSGVMKSFLSDPKNVKTAKPANKDRLSVTLIRETCPEVPPEPCPEPLG